MLDRIRIWLARWVLPESYRAVPCRILNDLFLAGGSGHLRHCYKVGRRVYNTGQVIQSLVTEALEK